MVKHEPMSFTWLGVLMRLVGLQIIARFGK